MIASLSRPISRRAAGKTLVLSGISQRQRRATARGRILTYSRKELASKMGLAPRRLERIECMAKLHLLEGLARSAPHVLKELGASPEQMNFLMAARFSPAGARRSWRRWCRLGGFQS